MIVTLKNTKISASINSIGAELFRLEKNNKNYIWTVDKTFWDKTSPILFPIVGQLKNDSYKLNNKSFELPRHGFARNFEFKIKNKIRNSALFSLKSNFETLQQFPFEFELKIEYRLAKNSLEISYLVSNKSNEVMPFSIGAHPAFNLEKTITAYSLVFNNTTDEFITHCLANNHFNNTTKKINSNNGTVDLNYTLFEKDALVFKHLKSNQVILKEKEKAIIKITFDDFPYLGIWTKPNASFICIEPWCGLADNINHNGNIMKKEGINILQPNESFQRKIKIEI